MKHFVVIICLFPLLSNAQSKKKKLQMAVAAEKKVNETLVSNLKNHVQYLADDKLEGRRAGTAGEKQAMQYIINQYQQAGLEPKGSNGYLQEFTINEGKQIDATTALWVNNKSLALQQDFFPLSYSALATVNGSAALSLNEPGNPWFRDVKEWLEDNANNPHYDIDDALKKDAEKAAKKGATALFIYNSATLIDNIQYNKNDKSAALKIPIIYITKSGLTKAFPDFSATQNIAATVNLSEKVRTAYNVAAYINNNAVNTIILGAHYDHLGYGEDKNALDTGYTIHNGADDNASGTAALIELAKHLKQASAKNNNYLFINFSGEELGLFGSKYWLDHPTTNIAANYMINMDMVGRYDSAHKLTIGGYGTSPVWGNVFETTTNKMLSIKFDSTGSGPSDHASFYRANMPVLFFFTGSHPDYHKSTDDWDKINYDGERQIVQYIYRLIETTDAKGKLVFTKTTEPQMGRSTFTASLGVIPDYGFTGTGVRIDGVSPGKLAEKLGLQAGDILLQLGDYKFVDVISYMQTLNKFKKGNATKLIIKRKEEEKSFDIVF
jgi:hypothetical protein